MGALIKGCARCGTLVTGVETVGMLLVGLLLMVMISVEVSSTSGLGRWRVSFARAGKAINSITDKNKKEVSEAVGWEPSTRWRKRPDVPRKNCCGCANRRVHCRRKIVKLKQKVSWDNVTEFIEKSTAVRLGS